MFIFLSLLDIWNNGWVSYQPTVTTELSASLLIQSFFVIFADAQIVPCLARGAFSNRLLPMTVLLPSGVKGRPGVMDVPPLT